MFWGLFWFFFWVGFLVSSKAKEGGRRCGIGLGRRLGYGAFLYIHTIYNGWTWLGYPA